jgi:hypothetical protein
MGEKILYLWFVGLTIFTSILIGQELGAMQATKAFGVPYQPFTFLLVANIIALMFWVLILYRARFKGK